MTKPTSADMAAAILRESASELHTFVHHRVSTPHMGVHSINIADLQLRMLRSIPLAELIEVARMLKEAQHALNVCNSDSHHIKSGYFDDHGHPEVEKVLNNIRKWSTEHDANIRKVLSALKARGVEL